MAKAYVIGHITVTNPQGYAQYAAGVPATLKPYGGTYVVRGGSAQVLEGSGLGERHVVIGFPSLEMAKAWYHSEAYAALIGVRQAHSHGQLVMVEGVAEEPLV